MSKRSVNGACLFYRSAIRPQASARAYQQPVQYRFADESVRENEVEAESDPSLALSPSQLEHQLRLGSTADVLRRVFLGPRTVQRARLINRRLYDEQFGPHDKRKTHPQRRRDQELANPNQWRETDEWLDSIEDSHEGKVDDIAMLAGKSEAGRQAERQAPHDRIERETEDNKMEKGFGHFRHPNDRENEREIVEKDQGKGGGPTYYRSRDIILARDPTLDLTMDLLRFQLRSSATPEDLTRVFTVAFQTRPGLRLLANPSLHRIIKKQLASSPPERVLGCLSLFIARLEAGKQVVGNDLIWQALLAASLSHSTTAIRRYMKMWQDHNRRIGLGAGPDAFLELLQSLRNGYRTGGHHHEPASRRAMLEIMYGFSDPGIGAIYNLRQHLPLHNRYALHLWIEMLVDLRAGDQIWNEWELLRARTSNTDGWKLDFEGLKRRSPPALFMRALFRVSEPKYAWMIFRLHSQAISDEDDTIWNALYQNISVKPALDEQSQQRLESRVLRLLEQELLILENNLGLKWKPTSDATTVGHHIADPKAPQSLFYVGLPSGRTVSSSRHAPVGALEKPSLVALKNSDNRAEFEPEPE